MFAAFTTYGLVPLECNADGMSMSYIWGRQLGDRCSTRGALEGSL